jgi:microcystin-dependent protein
MKNTNTKQALINRNQKNMIRTCLLILLATVFGNVTNAQVGFGNPAPDPSSILDLTANDKGLLIPRMPKSLREAILSPAQGLLVFETPGNTGANDNGSRGGFYYYIGTQWYSLNEWDRVPGSSTVSLTGNASVTGTITAATVTANNYTLNSAGNGPVPVGGIIMWSGAATAIPTGWVLCDGTSGTPDLRERFIVGAGGDNPTVAVNGTFGGPYNPGNTGGFNGVALTVAQMPSHSHTAGTAGSHQHMVKEVSRGDEGSSGTDQSVGSHDEGGTEKYTSFAGDHAHSISSTGGGAAHENRPPYYALAFIMKL